MKVTLEKTGNAANLAKSLGPALHERPESLTVVLPEGMWFFPDGAAWLTSLLLDLKADGIEVVFDATLAPESDTYLARMDFHRHVGLEPPDTGERHAAGGRFVPMLAISTPSEQFEAVNRIIDLLLMHFDNAREIVPAIEWALNEITDNVMIHAEARVPAFVFAQFYPEKHSLSVAICDAGQGLRTSLAQAHEIGSDAEALELAMQRGITSGKGQGNGIAGTRQILGVNGGGFSIWSGSAFHYEDPTHDYVAEIPACPGTGVALRFVTNRPIDLRDTFIESNPFTYIDSLAMKLSDDEALRVASECSSFGSRVPAHRLRRKILALLPDMEDRLTVDFGGVENVSSSFIDELLGKLIQELGFTRYRELVRVTNMNEATERRANVTIEQRLRSTMSMEQFEEEFGHLRPEPEFEFDGWLAYKPEELLAERDDVIQRFAEKWGIELDDETLPKLHDVWARALTSEDT